MTDAFSFDARVNLCSRRTGLLLLPSIARRGIDKHTLRTSRGHAYAWRKMPCLVFVIVFPTSAAHIQLRLPSDTFPKMKWKDCLLHPAGSHSSKTGNIEGRGCNRILRHG